MRVAVCCHWLWRRVRGAFLVLFGAVAWGIVGLDVELMLQFFFQVYLALRGTSSIVSFDQMLLGYSRPRITVL